MNLNELNEKIASILKEADIKEAEIESYYIIEAVLEISRAMYFLKKNDLVSEENVSKCMGIAESRKEHIPLQYLLGKQEFMGLEFRVTPDVLIPRQDTELLVEEVLKELKPGMKVLDMCTGSGCIAISVAKLSNGAKVTAVDISKEALAVAKKNGEQNQAEVRWIESDMFEQVTGTYDVIVSNPPYIKSDVIETLMPEVKDYEPRLALDGTADGLYFYRKLAKEAGSYLTKGGRLCLEIGYDQGEEVAEMLRENGYKEVIVAKDLCGLDRNVYGVFG